MPSYSTHVRGLNTTPFVAAGMESRPGYRELFSRLPAAPRGGHDFGLLRPRGTRPSTRPCRSTRWTRRLWGHRRPFRIGRASQSGPLRRGTGRGHEDTGFRTHSVDAGNPPVAGDAFGNDFSAKSPQSPQVM